MKFTISTVQLTTKHFALRFDKPKMIFTIYQFPWHPAIWLKIVSLPRTFPLNKPLWGGNFIEVCFRCSIYYAFLFTDIIRHHFQQHSNNEVTATTTIT